MIKFKECFSEKNKYDYLGVIYFKEDPIIQNFLKELDDLVRPKYIPNSSLNVLQLTIDNNSSIYINYYLLFVSIKTPCEYTRAFLTLAHLNDAHLGNTKLF